MKPSTKEPQSVMGASRASASHMAEDRAKRLDRRAAGFRVISRLAKEHLESGSQEESDLWDLVCSLH